jgi:pimeloyl-ACP methyl ester carboxylesterase
MTSITSLSSKAVAPIAALLALAAAPAATLAQAGPDRPPEPAKAAATARSRDGTAIAYEKSGKGPVIVLVAGALSDRSGASRLAALLARDFTVINYDRRGRGESGDAKPYALEREIEDIEALIDKAGGSASLFGSSSGAALALEAANRLAAKVEALALFEPPYIVDDSRPPIPDALLPEIASLLAADRRGDAVALFMTKAIGVPEEMVAGMKQAPMWKGMAKLAHTLPYDFAIVAGLQTGKPLPAKRWTKVKARTLVLDGERSDPFLRNAAKALAELISGAERRSLPGQDHSAVFTAPEAVAAALVEFLAARKPDKAPE